MIVAERGPQLPISREWLNVLGAIPVRQDDAAPGDPQERYLIARIDGSRTVGDLVRLSTLGPPQTMRVLHALAERGAIAEASALSPAVRAAPPTAATSGRIETVLVADADRTQASLLRTMLRVSLSGSVVFHTAADSEALTSLAERHRPDLLAIDYRLPGGGDGLALLRALRARQGAALTPSLIVGQKIEADFIRARLLPQTSLVVRPIDRATLTSAIREVVPNLE